MATAKKPTGIFYDLKAEAQIPDDIIVTPTIALTFPTKKQMDEYRDAETADDAHSALFGPDTYAKLKELFADERPQVWAGFVKYVNEHWFGKGADEVEGK
ncbi:tail assembly chaperone [Gordonia phage Neville]|nr:tail assembly chaperone [Gordonia phage Neville]YP_010246009.1 tail assembly chaperone [Gordonia phage Trax]AXQ64395.1 tail assembly chaperone [Gordonia phage Neville]QDM55910.1 tail assembly chaperone [Gordonia phage Trax]